MNRNEHSLSSFAEYLRILIYAPAGLSFVTA